jgi:hypothetical protein
MVFILFLACFILLLVKSGSTIICFLLYVCLSCYFFFILLVYFFLLIIIFFFSCVDIGISTPAQLDEASKSRLGYCNGTGLFANYFYIVLC